jgi:hypothetical protein
MSRVVYHVEWTRPLKSDEASLKFHLFKDNLFFFIETVIINSSVRVYPLYLEPSDPRFQEAVRWASIYK